MTKVRSAVLTLGAILGTACLLVAVAGAVMGVKALVFRSGSMGPDIPAGSLGFTRPAAAAQLSVGDIVSVVNARSTRVTHRVVGISGAGDVRVLTLQGDANPAPDAESYEVTRVDRVVFAVPVLGHAVSWLGSPIGLFCLGGAAVGIVVLGFSARPKPGPGRRRAVASIAAPAVAAVVLLTATSGTMAQFTDGAAVTGASLASGSVQAPTTATSNCTASNGVLGSSITFRWNGIVPAAPPRPQLADQSYELRFFNRSNNSVMGVVSQAHVGAAGATQTYTASSSTLAGLLGLNLLNFNQVRLEVYTKLGTTSWYSTPVTTNWTVTTLLGIATFTCNA